MPDGLISAPLGSKLYRTSTKKKIESGDQITITTDDPTTKPVPSEKDYGHAMGPELDRQYYRAAEPRDEVFEEDDDVSDTGALSQFPSAAFQSLSIHQLPQSKDKDAPKAGTLLQALNLNSAGRGIRQSPKSKSKDNHNDSKPVALFQTLNLNSAGRGVHEGFDPKVKNYTDHQERYRVRKRISGGIRLSRPVMKKGSCVIFPSPPSKVTAAMVIRCFCFELGLMKS